MKQLDNTLNTHTSREEWEGSSDLGVAQFGEMSWKQVTQVVRQE